MGIGIVSTNKGDFTFQSPEDAIKFIRTAAQEHNDMWISGEQPYPCIAVCINGEYAAVNFFQTCCVINTHFFIKRRYRLFKTPPIFIFVFLQT